VSFFSAESFSVRIFLCKTGTPYQVTSLEINDCEKHWQLPRWSQSSTRQLVRMIAYTVIDLRFRYRERNSEEGACGIPHRFLRVAFTEIFHRGGLWILTFRGRCQRQSPRSENKILQPYTWRGSSTKSKNLDRVVLKSVSSTAEFHQTAHHASVKVPGLVRLRVWTDSHA
jgi:hypothetical protein